MALTKVKLQSLKLADYNPREINKAELEALKQSIKDFGLRGLITVNTYKAREKMIVGGNMTVHALKELGWKEIPKENVDFVKLTKEKEMTLSLALNRIGQKRNWNDEKLAEIMWKLNRADADLTSTGFDEVEKVDKVNITISTSRAELLNNGICEK